jgi:hypothetical protein
MVRKMNPKSLENLRMGQSPGRKSVYTQSKHRHGVTLTDDAWGGVQAIAHELGVSVSELFERIGRNQLAVVEPHTSERILSRVENQKSEPIQQGDLTPTALTDGLLIFTSEPEANAYPLENSVYLTRENRMAKLLNSM